MQPLIFWLILQKMKPALNYLATVTTTLMYHSDSLCVLAARTSNYRKNDLGRKHSDLNPGGEGENSLSIMPLLTW